jgi:hypothetical protein
MARSASFSARFYLIKLYVQIYVHPFKVKITGNKKRRISGKTKILLILKMLSNICLMRLVLCSRIRLHFTYHLASAYAQHIKCDCYVYIIVRRVQGKLISYYNHLHCLMSSPNIDNHNSKYKKSSLPECLTKH